MYAPRRGDGPLIHRTFVKCPGPAKGPTAWCKRAIADLAFWFAGRSLGCFNPRKQRGSTTTWSLHACGRAVDWAPPDEATGWRVVAFVLLNWPTVQRIIYRRWQWYADGRGWRAYNADDHLDHVHVESNSPF